VFSPPRHQGHQAHPPILCEPQRTQRAQSHPPAQKRRGAETQRRRESCRRLHRMARSRPSNGGMYRLTSSGETSWPPNDGHGTTGSGNRVESKLSCWFPDPVACALEERRSRHLSFLFSSDGTHASPTPYVGEERQNRRASGTSDGEKVGWGERLRSEQTAFSPATGDHPIACRSAVNQRDRISGSATASLRLCVFASLRSFLFLGWVRLRRLAASPGQVGALRLCGSAPLRYFWCSPLVSWCLGGSKTTRHP
jgi:hypothetical protein